MPLGLGRQRASRLLTVGLSVALGTAAALPAVWWEPLHLDEAIMLQFSRESPASIVKDVFIDRGGAPAQFFVEHATLSWSPGLAALRVPSLLFFLLSLPLAAAFARRLLGERAGLLLPFVLGLAPLAVQLATFARMYALFLCAVLGVTCLGMIAAERREPRWWCAAGAGTGLLVYVHPIAPLYAPLALLTGLAARPSWRTSVRELRPAVIAAVVVATPYVYALGVLGRRYHVAEARRLQTTAGRSVPVESLHALTPGGTPGVLFFVALALVGLAWVWRTQRRPVAVALAAWLVVPVAFFTIVPAQTRFFDRYLIPALPAFLLLVIAGCCGLVSMLRAPFGVAALLALVLVLVAIQGHDDVEHLRTLRALHLPALASAVRPGDVLFSSTGSPISDRPPELLDDYVALRSRTVARVEELPAIDPRFEQGLVQKGRANVAAFLRSGLKPARGDWIFRGRASRVDALLRRLAPDFDTRRVSPGLALVRSRAPASPRGLVREALRVRQAWGLSTPADRWPRVIATVDRSALSR